MYVLGTYRKSSDSHLRRPREPEQLVEMLRGPGLQFLLRLPYR